MSDESASAETLQVIREVWELNQDEEYRQDQSHWRGTGRWDEASWLSIGNGTRNSLQPMIDLFFPDRTNLHVLEWGPGGGSNLYAMADISKVLFGVDISQKNLDECQRVLDEIKPKAFQPLLVDSDPEAVLTKEKFNVFISTAVFQHFPTKEYGVRVLKAIFPHMSNPSIGIIRMRFDNGHELYQPKKLQDYVEQHITATSYRIDEFWQLLVDAGFKVVHIEGLNTNHNLATFVFRKNS